MSHVLGANQHIQETSSIGYQCLGAPTVDEGITDIDFSLPNLDCADPDLFFFDPFTSQSASCDIANFLSPGIPGGVIDQTLTKGNDAFQRSDELNVLHTKLQKRIDELEATCKRLENEYGSEIIVVIRKCADDFRFHCIQR